MFEIESSQKSENQSTFKFDVSAGPALPIERINEAIDAFELGLPPVPYDEEKDKTLLASAKLLIRNKEYSLARGLLRSILANNSKFYDAIYWMGFCLRAEKQIDEAIRLFECLVSIRADLPSCFELAETYYLAQRDQDALNYYFKALGQVKNETPILFDIHKNLGNIFVRMGDLEAAEENYNKANTLFSNSDVLLVNYGTLELQRQNIDRALERFRQAIQVNPKNDKAWVGLSLVHREFGDFELSWGNIETALDLQPTNKVALQVISEWAARDGRHQDAIERLQTYLATHDQDAEISLLLVQLLLSSRKISEVAIEVQRLENLVSDHPILAAAQAAVESARAEASAC